jgi:hypothetical protein
MRFYPFGSGSIPAIVVSASLAQYAVQTQAATSVINASFAPTGRQGDAGPLGPCIYASGSAGAQGPSGSQGPVGTVDGPYA